MIVEQLEDGKLRVPMSIETEVDGKPVLVDGVEVIGPDHPDYEEYLAELEELEVEDEA